MGQTQSQNRGGAAPLTTQIVKVDGKIALAQSHLAGMEIASAALEKGQTRG
jgi:hypothetical protein